MTTDNKSNKEEEVGNDQTKSEEVVNSGLTENEIISDILGSSDSSPAENEESKKDDDAEESEDDKGGSDESKDEETDTKSAEKKDDDDETKDEDDKTNSDEVFATIGAQKFKTKEELLNFTKSNIGYNTWATGAIKSLHPEYFNKDGSIKSKEFQGFIESKGKKAEKASQVIADVAEKDPDDITKEDVADVEKAKAILRPLGVVFADDPEYLKLKKSSQVIEDKEFSDVKASVTAFEEKHPLLKDHRMAVADLMDKNGYDLETAWKVQKTLEDIVEDEPLKSKKSDVVVKKAADSAIPATVKKQSGNLPSSGAKDFMDDLIGLNQYNRT